MDDEATILTECRSGQLGRFAELYDSYSEAIYRFVYYKTQHRETAEDLTSLVWLKALEKISSFRAGSLQAWLYRIARNTVIDYYRTRKFDRSVEDAWDLPERSSLASEIEQRDLLDRVRADLHQLPSLQRDILVLRIWEGYSFAEIAEIVGTSEGNCKVIVSRSLKRIRSASALLLFLSLFSTCS